MGNRTELVVFSKGLLGNRTDGVQFRLVGNKIEQVVFNTGWWEIEQNDVQNCRLVGNKT